MDLAMICEVTCQKLLSLGQERLGAIYHGRVTVTVDPDDNQLHWQYYSTGVVYVTRDVPMRPG